MKTGQSPRNILLLQLSMFLKDTIFIVIIQEKVTRIVMTDRQMNLLSAVSMKSTAVSSARMDF